MKFEVLLYDLTSTYFESAPPFPEGDKRRYGHSRDKRSDCVQVVIALVVTPEGFPLAYEVMAGNTSDRTTLGGFLKRIEELHGKAERVLERIITGENIGTLFMPRRNLGNRARWILNHAPEGKITIDDGAVAPLHKRKSLLPSGIRSIEGRFEAGRMGEAVGDERGLGATSPRRAASAARTSAETIRLTAA